MFSSAELPSRNCPHTIRSLARVCAILFPFLFVTSVAFTASECLAATNTDDVFTSSSATTAKTADDDATAADRGPGILDGLIANNGDDTLDFTGTRTPLVIDDLLERSLKTQHTISDSALSRRCVLFEKTLCGALENRRVIVLGAAQTGALISDGVTTRQYLRRGYVEVDPLTRAFLGRTPTWSRMAPLGAVQVVAGMWLAERMSKSQHVWVRRLWWLPQTIGIAGNVSASAHNATLR